MTLPQHALAGLKPRRIARNLSREDMAGAIGVTATSYDRFENGTRRLYFDKACVLADTLGCSLDDLRCDPNAVAEAQPDIVVNLARDDVAAADVLGPDWSVEP